MNQYIKLRILLLLLLTCSFMTSNALGAWYNSPTENDVYNYSDVYFEVHVFDLGPATNVYVDGIEINLSDVHSVVGHYVISGNWTLNDGFHSTYANDTILGTVYSTDTIHFLVDANVPNVIINTKSMSYNQSTDIINVTVSDVTNVSVIAEIDGNTTNIKLTKMGDYYVDSTYVFSEGTHNVRIYATDALNHTNSTETVNFTVDQSKPELNVTVPEDTNSTTIPISINVSEPANTTINVYDENGTLIKNITVIGNDTVNVNVSGEGTYVVNVTTTDNAGNSVSSTTQVTVDQSKPELNVTVPEDTNSTTIPISINVSEPANTTINVYDENGTLIKNITVIGNDTVNVNVSGEGTYVVNVTTTDNAGNSVSSTTQVTVEKLLDNVRTSGSSTRSHSSGGGGGILSSSNFFSSFVVIYGTEIDHICCQYFAGINAYNDSGEYTGNIIIIGGSNANKYAEKYNEQFEIPISNKIPGENTGVIQVLKLQDNSEIVLKTTTILYLAGSDRYGTQAAVYYAKNMTELPSEPITVKWTANGPVLVE